MKALILCSSTCGLLLASSGWAGSGKSAASAALAPAASPHAPRWRVGLGAQWRSLDRLNLKVTPHASLGVAGRLVDSPGVRFPGSGPAAGTGDRQYADGFVSADEGTALDGTTWWWGYESASQIRGDSLVFTAQGEYTTASSSSRADLWHDTEMEEDGFGPVLEVAVEWELPGDWRAGMEFSFSFLGIDATRSAPVFSGRQLSESYRITDTDTYPLQGVVVPVAPYQGTAAGPGPLIDNIPSRSRAITPAGKRGAILKSVAKTNFSADVYNFSFGPSATWERGRLSLHGSAALELDVVPWDLVTTEVLTVSGTSGRRQLSRWQDRASGTDVLPGLGLGFRAAWEFRPQWDVAGSAKWRAMQSLHTGTGNTQATLNSGGWTLGLTVGYSF